MGAILNRFDKLSELRESEDLQKKYVLTGVIVHDPKDKELCEHIRKKFIKFAKWTGENFLFLTFIQPSKKDAEEIKNGRHSYARLLTSESEQTGNVEKLVYPLLKNQYRIYGEGSYLILSKGLSNKNYHIVKITKSSLANQFMSLESYCDDPDDIDKLIKELNAESYNAKEALADSILKISSLISNIQKGNEGLYSYRQQELAQKTILEEKQNLIEAMRNLGDDDKTEEILNFYNLIEHTYINVLHKTDTPWPTKKCKNYSKLNSNSKKFWNTFDRLSKGITEKERSELDYSAFTLYLSKILENELNLSVAQMIRGAMGIDMPTYYNRYCDKKGKCEVYTKTQSVLMNCYIKDKSTSKKILQGIPLGNLFHVYKTIVGEEYPKEKWELKHPERVVKLPSDFVDLWKEFIAVRNNAAHTGDVTKEAFEKANKEFLTFQHDYVNKLFEIKKDLCPKKDYKA